jgi:hypothetical protein
VRTTKTTGSLKVIRLGIAVMRTPR